MDFFISRMEFSIWIMEFSIWIMGFFTEHNNALFLTAFAELQTEVSDFTSDINVIGVPFWDYRTYTFKVLFPSLVDHAVLHTQITVSSKYNHYCIEYCICSYFSVHFTYRLRYFSKQLFQMLFKIWIIIVVSVALSFSFNYTSIVIQ